MRATDLTLFQQEVLLALADDGPTYGTALMSSLEERYGTEMSVGRIYPNLDDLSDMGLVECDEFDGRTNMYSITDDGVELMRADTEERLRRLRS